MPSWKEQSATYLHKAWAEQSFHRVKNVDLSPAQLTPSAEASLRAQLTPPPFIAPEAPGERPGERAMTLPTLPRLVPQAAVDPGDWLRAHPPNKRYNRTKHRDDWSNAPTISPPSISERLGSRGGSQQPPLAEAVIQVASVPQPSHHMGFGKPSGSRLVWHNSGSRHPPLTLDQLRERQLSGDGTVYFPSGVVRGVAGRYQPPKVLSTPTLRTPFGNAGRLPHTSVATLERPTLTPMGFRASPPVC